MLCPIILVICYKRLYKAPPQGSVVLETVRVFTTAFKQSGFKGMFKGGDAFWDAAKPTNIAAREGSIDLNKINWDDKVSSINERLYVEKARRSRG